MNSAYIFTYICICISIYIYIYIYIDVGDDFQLVLELALEDPLGGIRRIAPIGSFCIVVKPDCVYI